MKNTVFAHTTTIAVLLLASGSAFAQTQPAPAAATAEQKAPPAAEAKPAATPEPKAAAEATGDQKLSGLGAVYSDRLNGHKTASGKRYDKNALTAAHPTLPFGSKVKITNEKNGKSVVVTINDRGPTQPDRVVDISRAAAKKIGIGPKSMAPVKLEVVS